MPKRLLTLRWRLALLPGALALAFALVAAVVMDWSLRRQALQAAEADVRRGAHTLAFAVERALDRRVTDLQLLAHHLGRAPLDDATSLRAGLQTLQRHVDGYAWIGFIDTRGRVLAATDGLLEGADLSQRPVFTRGRQGIFIGDLHPAVALAPFLPEVDGEPAVLLDIALPVRDAQGRLVGVMGAHLMWDWFNRMRRQVQAEVGERAGLRATVRSPTGRVLRGDDRLHWPSSDPPREAPAGPSAEVVQRTDDGPAGGLAAVRTFTPRSAAGVLGWQVVVVQDLQHSLDAARRTFWPLLGWSLASVQDLQHSLDAARRTFWPLLGWSLASVLAFGVLGLLLSRRLSQPYHRALEGAARRLTGRSASASGTELLDTLVEQLDGLPDDAAAGRALTGEAVLARLVHDADRLQALIESLPTPVFFIGTDGRLQYWNRACEKSFGWPADQALGQPLAQLLPPLPGRGFDWMGCLASVDQRRQPLDFELEVRGRHAPVMAEWRLVPLRDRDGQPLGVLGQAQDLTEARRAARRLMEQDTETTRRLAQALHDQLGQTLAALRLSWDALQQAGPWPVGSRHHRLAGPIGELIGLAVAQVRQVLGDLRPPLLEEQGLRAALEQEFYRGSVSAGLGATDVLVETDDALHAQRWPAPVEHAAFMIAREAVANALQHAEASLVRVVIEGGPQVLSLSIVDDGRGIARADQGTPPPPRPGHLGMLGMRERAAAIGAVFDMRPGEGGGTIVRLHWTTTAS